MNELNTLKNTVEALIFISGDGITISEISKGIDKPKDEIKIVLDSLIDEYAEKDGGIILNQNSDKYYFSTNASIYNDLKSFIAEKKKETLSKAMLETLAIIAYKQPVTLTEVEEIRGVNSRAFITALTSKKLIKQTGRKEIPGKPALYSTTKEFLDYFGLSQITELPPLKEIKELNFEEL
ncbi:MAG: SMC-Scp complex subunit ScpB [Spirochaetia bacterium]|nr:SMC-Scp complex subunit ScpB [Spirochaetia bacterium]